MESGGRAQIRRVSVRRAQGRREIRLRWELGQVAAEVCEQVAALPPREVAKSELDLAELVVARHCTSLPSAPLMRAQSAEP